MADILQIKRSLTATAVPSAGALAEGELAVNIPDKMMWIGDDSGNPILIVDNGTQIVDAIDVTYDNSTSGLTATDVQTAIDEVVADLNTHTSDTNNPHSTNWGNLGGLPTDFPPSPHDHDAGYY